MKLIPQPSRPLVGKLSLPGDKSLSHRAALLAALASDESSIENFLVAGVTQAMLSSLSHLGVPWKLEGNRLTIQGQGLHGLLPPREPLHCGNSATTLRLLAGALAAAGIPAVLDGSAGLRRRPMGRICVPLRQMGAGIEAADQDTAPLRLSGRSGRQRLQGLDHSLSIASAQVKSCLLLAGLDANGPVILREPGPSRDHTERMLSSLGLPIRSSVEESNRGKVYVTRLEPVPDLELPPLQLCLPGDFSAAAFVIVAALIVPGSDLLLQGVGLNPTRTGLLDVLRQMGGQIEISNGSERAGEPVGDVRVRASLLHGVEVNGETVVRMIDEFPALAVAAAFAEGLTRVVDAVELRHKESDRIATVCHELQAIGAKARETADGFEIQGSSNLPGGTVKTYGDHRLALSLSVAGLACQGPVTVWGAEIMAESFPNFVDLMTKAGASFSCED